MKKEVNHRLNRRCQVKHRCIQRTMFQRRCQVPRSQVFSTGLTDGASEHSIGAMTSAEVGGPTASPGTVCDRFNRRPMHRRNLVCQLSQVRKPQWHRLNRRGQVKHQCNGRRFVQRRCQERRSHAFSTG